MNDEKYSFRYMIHALPVFSLCSNATSSEKSSVNALDGAEYAFFVPSVHLVIYLVIEWTVCLHAVPSPLGMS